MLQKEKGLSLFASETFFLITSGPLLSPLIHTNLVFKQLLPLNDS